MEPQKEKEMNAIEQIKAELKGKQIIVISENDGIANIKWDCRSLDDVKALLASAQSFIADKQVEELRGIGSGPDYNTTEGRFRNAHKFQQEQPNAYDVAMLEVKKYVDKLYDNASIGLNEYDSGLYNGITETCMKLRGFIKARTSKEQSEVDYNKFEKLFDDFCERNKGHHITSRDACMWFWELGLKARKEDTK